MIKLDHRIVLTELCNASCPHCFNADFRKTGNMDADILLKFIKVNYNYLKQSELKIMGGEPTLHPRLADITIEACRHYRLVTIFTNGTKMRETLDNKMVVKNHLYGRLKFVINGFVFNPDTLYEYTDSINYVNLHFVVPLNGVDEVIEKAIRCMDLAPFVQFTISPDTQVDIFDDNILNQYRNDWIDAVTVILPKLRRRGIVYEFDHSFPMCFYTQDMLDVISFHDLNALHKARITCSGDSLMGLIDYNFDLYYCNQTRIKLGSILKDNGDVKTMDEIINMIQRGSRMKTNSIMELSDKCKGCAVLASCKVGCYYNTLVGR